MNVICDKAKGCSTKWCKHRLPHIEEEGCSDTCEFHDEVTCVPVEEIEKREAKIKAIIKVLSEKCLNDYGFSLDPLYNERYMIEIAEEILDRI